MLATGDRSEVPLPDPELPQPGRASPWPSSGAPRSCSASPVGSPALRSMDRNVVYVGSFSKTFAPGLRVGWALAPPVVRDRLVLAAESAVLCPLTFTRLLVSRHLAGHDWRAQIKTFTDTYRDRRDTMVRALETCLPDGCTWNVPDGGFYVWLTVPESIDTKAMLPRAVSARVAYASGTGFYADGPGSRQLRLLLLPPRRSASPKASAGSRASWRRSSTSGAPSARECRRGRTDGGRAGWRPLARAGGLAPVGSAAGECPAGTRNRGAGMGRRRRARRRRPAHPDWIALPHTAFRPLGAQAVLDAMVDRLGLPLILKPDQGGSALGAQVVSTRSELPPAMVSTLAYADSVLAERFVVGTELAVSVIEDGGDRVSAPRWRSRHPAGSTTSRPATRPAPRRSTARLDWTPVRSRRWRMRR